MNQELEPVPRRSVRIGLLIALWAIGFIGSTPWLSKIGFAVGTLLILGTYRRFRVTPKSLMQRWTIGFVNLPHQSFRLKKYSFLEVKYERQTGVLEFLLFGPVGFIFGWIVDRFLPWIGGDVSDLAQQRGGPARTRLAGELTSDVRTKSGKTAVRVGVANPDALGGVDIQGASNQASGRREPADAHRLWISSTSVDHGAHAPRSPGRERPGTAIPAHCPR